VVWPWSATTLVTQAAVDEALAANPDVAERFMRQGGGRGRDRRCGDEGHRGQADAARVRELVLAACGRARRSQPRSFMMLT